MKPIISTCALLAATGILAVRVQGGQAYFPSEWNGRKVYLSPALHVPENVGCDSYRESEGARLIAAVLKDSLLARNYAVMVGDQDYVANTSESNGWSSSVHVPIHSNAGAWDCGGGACLSGGTWLMYQTGDGRDQQLAQPIVDSMSGSSPGCNDRIGSDEALSGFGLYELRGTSMPAAYVESAFHTHGPDVSWLRQAGTVAGGIAEGIDRYFGYPRCPPCPTQAAEPSLTAEPGAASSMSEEPSAASSMNRERRPWPELWAALDRVVAGPPSSVSAAGALSVFSEATAGMVNEVTIDKTGLVIVDFADLSAVIPNASTAAGRGLMWAELNAAVFASPEARAVLYRIDGNCERFARWLQTSCEPVTRTAWRARQGTGPGPRP